MDCNNKVAGCRLPVAGVLLLVAAFAFAAPRWRIRTHITVRQSVVRLGDLVNPQAELPASLRALQLGVAPQPGTPLRWSREQFTARLRSAGVAPGEFAIPKVIEIRREAQPVPAAAVHEAIATFLHRTLAPADIRFTPPLTTATTPVVAVLRSVPDLVHGRLEVICRAQNDPRLLPFAVSVRMPAAALARQELRRGVQKSDAAVRTPLVPQPELVKPGRMAKLVISQPGFAMTTLVQPLQAGRKGDHIRVRSLATKAILQVLVTGHDQVGILPRSLAILPQGGIHGRN